MLVRLSGGPICWRVISREEAYTRCTNSEKRSQNSHFARLNSESNTIFDNSLNNNYL